MKDYQRVSYIIIVIIGIMGFTYFAHERYTAVKNWQYEQYEKIENMLDMGTDSCYDILTGETSHRAPAEADRGDSPVISPVLN